MPESSERGALTEAVYYILISLYTPLHGYGIMQNIERMSRGRVTLGAGTLYGALNTLQDKGLIVSVSGATESRKKEYVITERGKRVIATELERLEELLTNGRQVMGGIGHENHNS